MLQGSEDTCAEDACFYPPDVWMAPTTERCLGKFINEYIKCYTDGQDNSQCCDDAGVSGLTGICQQFCNGVNPKTWANPAYGICKSERDEISNCNHAAVKPE
uniref:Domain of unknown function DB domain-containing protein n=1 Tax=Ditylenchus dipsaci TaxID=166011 RepID=A0A915DHN1_9BILA